MASLVWGSVGLGFAVFGKKQGEWVTLSGGIALMAVSYFIGSALYMSLVSVLLIAAVIWLRRRF